MLHNKREIITTALLCLYTLRMPSLSTPHALTPLPNSHRVRGNVSHQMRAYVGDRRARQEGRDGGAVLGVVAEV